jgi:hypothetical protein
MPVAILLPYLPLYSLYHLWPNTKVELIAKGYIFLMARMRPNRKLIDRPILLACSLIIRQFLLFLAHGVNHPFVALAGHLYALWLDYTVA